MSIRTNELCELEQAARAGDPTATAMKYARQFDPKAKRHVATLEQGARYPAIEKGASKCTCNVGAQRSAKVYNMGARVLFVSTHSSPDDLIKMIIGDGVKPTARHDRCNDYEWTVKNKVPVRLCALNLSSIYKLFYKFPETVKSVVVYVNLDSLNWLPELDKIRYFLVNICKPTLRVCCISEWSQNQRDNERIKAWCHKYDFEMVNLNPDEEDLRVAWESSIKVGVERLAQIIDEWY